MVCCLGHRGEEVKPSISSPLGVLLCLALLAPTLAPKLSPSIRAALGWAGLVAVASSIVLLTGCLTSTQATRVAAYASRTLVTSASVASAVMRATSSRAAWELAALAAGLFASAVSAYIAWLLMSAYARGGLERTALLLRPKISTPSSSSSFFTPTDSVGWLT